ncbi:concanavalin A-like lectin/glucanase domain-containing protein [Chaetomium fimeti]|uniref:Concanavalin A-like lectin/glucanase domain-containing protein n=1 Tax=Chaetomium fimeti TaxID=1854472 RepID=A0AAE0LVS0_9PEZI|nr:concanavalin A-like lectin/glucanase domain-containing protein [Chaetomium fimeti]
MPTAGPTANNTVGVYAASFWVGIDSATPASAACGGGGGSLRAGVDVFWDGTLDGAQKPVAWFQGPGQGAEEGFGGGFVVGEGDLVRFTLGLEAGGVDGAGEEVVVVAENFGRNVTCVGEGAVPVGSVRKVLPAGGEGEGLCRREAAWVVEDFPIEGMPELPVALVDFGSVTFGAGVTLEDGSERDLAGAEVLDVKLEEQGGRLTSCEIVDGKKVKCARVVGDN